MDHTPKSEDGKSGDCNASNIKTRSGGSKLARRARSFKDDFLDILNAMRSPSNASNGSRSSSPKSRRNRSRSPKHRLSSASDPYDSCSTDNPLKDLEFHVRQVQFALRHFQDVVSKNKLEVLPGNGTVVLETITNIHSVLKPYAFDEQSSSVVSGLHQVYLSVAKLIKLCDNLLISGEKALDRDYVSETVRLVEEAVQNLVNVAGDKIIERDSRGLYSSSTSSRCSTMSSDPSHYRVSLPDIPLTPHELQILEQTSYSVLENHGTRIFDFNDIPPPKPPLPHRTLNNSPPPLPPKKRIPNSNPNTHNTVVAVNNTGTMPGSFSLERLSLKSNGSSVTSLESMVGACRTDGQIIDDCCGVLQNHSCLSSSSGFTSQNSSHQQSFCTSMGADGTHIVTTTTHCQSATTTITSFIPSVSDDFGLPPQLPVKTRRIRNELSPLTLNSVFTNQNQMVPRIRCNESSSNGHNSDSGTPPPLPLKKKHIMAYMEMFGNCSHGNTAEFLRHSVHTYSLLQTEWQQHQMTLTSAQSCSFDAFSHSSSHSGNFPPALPPKRSHMNSIRSSQSLVQHKSSPSSPVVQSPPLPQHLSFNNGNEDNTKPGLIIAETCSPVIESPINNEMFNDNSKSEQISKSIEDPLAEIDVSKWLIFKRPDEDVPDIRGGHPDALIVLATKANKNDFLYQEAFLTTYRTFLTPLQLIQKLMERYHRFDTPSNPTRQRAARESFSLLVRVVGDLTFSDLETNLVEIVMDFVYQLLSNGDLIMGKALRVKLLEKYLAKLQRASNDVGALSSQNIYTRQATLLDFKSEHIAEQMTLLDAELFMNIEIPEVLTWIQEQNEEKSPNLTLFTEHFNKMSYWARSRILEQDDAKDRERYVLKFIKIMKHLRKMNNFNSYLALLSALDSAPIRRLEWQKTITEGLKEYCALIDSSSSFRAYRQALAETQPPCIPYIGLVLQDLTFVQIGNSDYLSDGIINFSKRWQQFNIVENMKRFKKVLYNFKTHERIVAFFSNFDEFLCEEAMWQISESIKPRGVRKLN